MKYALFLAALSLAACSGAETPAASEVAAEAVQETPSSASRGQAGSLNSDDPTVYSFEIVNTYPHDTGAFTQGLLWKDGYLYEGTGRHGQSGLRKVELETGEVIQRQAIPTEYFGEGIVDWQDRFIGLTWQSGKAFVFDSETFAITGEHTYDGEGWGLTRNDEHLIMSDGTDVLRFIDPETFEVVRQLNVSIKGQPLIRLNELEWVDGEIFANVWQSDALVRIDPETGVVTGLVNLRPLAVSAGMAGHRDFVLNGIAWDAENDRLFVTGKYWPSLFEIRIAPAG